MTTSAAALPVLPVGADIRTIIERVNVLIRQYNRPDLFIPSYAADTGSGAAYAIAPSTDVKLYEVGQVFNFAAANANTVSNPTLNVNGLGAGTITYPDGSALGLGDIAANGFYDVEVTSTTPTFALRTVPVRRLLQTVATETGAVNTGTTTIPFDDTIPQNTEGDQYMSLSITPKSATSRLIIDVVAIAASSAAGTNGMTATLCQDSAANALAAAVVPAVQNVTTVVSFRHVMTSGTTSATTFKVRMGSNAAGTTTFNGQLGGRIYGGVMASGIVIQEVLP